MATVENKFFVGFKRTFQIKQYNPQTIELAISANSMAELRLLASPDNLAELVKVYDSLEAIGNAALAKALAQPDPTVASGDHPGFQRPSPGKGR